MKQAAVKTTPPAEVPAAANSNDWIAQNNTANLRLVLREWGNDAEEFQPLTHSSGK